MNHLNEIYVASQKAEKTRRLATEMKLKAAGSPVIRWRDGKPVVRKQAGSRT